MKNKFSFYNIKNKISIEYRKTEFLAKEIYKIQIKKKNCKSRGEKKAIRNDKTEIGLPKNKRNN